MIGPIRSFFLSPLFPSPFLYLSDDQNSQYKKKREMNTKLKKEKSSVSKYRSTSFIRSFFSSSVPQTFFSFFSLKPSFLSIYLFSSLFIYFFKYENLTLTIKSKSQSTIRKNHEHVKDQSLQLRSSLSWCTYIIFWVKKKCRKIIARVPTIT